MNEITTQTYEQWVAEGRPLVERWKGATLEVCRFLYPKREELSRTRPGANVSDETLPTWQQFLADIGLHRVTAHNWLAKYDAKSDRLLPPPDPKPEPDPEMIQRRQEKLDLAKEEVRQKRQEWAEQDTYESAEDALFEAAIGASIENHAQRQAFKERIRISQAGESDAFIDALMDYLEELDNDNRRIEACQNIIKVCRNIAVELQTQSEKAPA